MLCDSKISCFESATCKLDFSVVRFHFFVPIKRTEILLKKRFQVHNDNLTVSCGSQAPPGPGGGAYSTPAKPPSWILRGPTSKERIEQRREGNKEKEGRRGKWKRGEGKRGVEMREKRKEEKKFHFE